MLDGIEAVEYEGLRTRFCRIQQVLARGYLGGITTSCSRLEHVIANMTGVSHEHVQENKIYSQEKV